MTAVFDTGNGKPLCPENSTAKLTSSFRELTFPMRRLLLASIVLTVWVPRVHSSDIFTCPRRVY